MKKRNKREERWRREGRGEYILSQTDSENSYCAENTWDMDGVWLQQHPLNTDEERVSWVWCSTPRSVSSPKGGQWVCVCVCVRLVSCILMQTRRVVLTVQSSILHRELTGRRQILEPTRSCCPSFSSASFIFMSVGTAASTHTYSQTLKPAAAGRCFLRQHPNKKDLDLTDLKWA